MTSDVSERTDGVGIAPTKRADLADGAGYNDLRGGNRQQLNPSATVPLGSLPRTINVRFRACTSETRRSVLGRFRHVAKLGLSTPMHGTQLGIEVRPGPIAAVSGECALCIVSRVGAWPRARRLVLSVHLDIRLLGSGRHARPMNATPDRTRGGVNLGRMVRAVGRSAPQRLAAIGKPMLSSDRCCPLRRSGIWLRPAENASVTTPS
ncbi:MAG: hypothetical protein JWN43_863 [Gammaproteobacteria bacterium]|nr:hypothetical protein [Gammaproteobacteria bacterium]